MTGEQWTVLLLSINQGGCIGVGWLRECAFYVRQFIVLEFERNVVLFDFTITRLESVIIYPAVAVEGIDEQGIA